MKGDKEKVRYFLKLSLVSKRTYGRLEASYLPCWPIVRVGTAHVRNRIQFQGAMSLEEVIPMLWSKFRDGVGWVVGQRRFKLFHKFIVALGFVMLVARAWSGHDCELQAKGRERHRNPNSKI